MALASYAKQADDDELMKMATRIRDRAIRRAGELLQQIQPSKGGRPNETGVGGHGGISGNLTSLPCQPPTVRPLLTAGGGPSPGRYGIRQTYVLHVFNACARYVLHVFNGMHAVIETPTFLRRADDAGMTDGERFDLVSFIASNPEAGDVIQGTGGVRKVRFAGRGKGKSGAYRVITFFTGPSLPVFLLTVYPKGVKDTLTKAERNDLAKLTKVLADTYAAKVRPIRQTGA